MEIDKIKKVMMGKASREDREEVEAWAGGSAEQKRFVEDARGFYDFPLGCCGGLCAFGGRDRLERMVAGYA